MLKGTVKTAYAQENSRTTTVIIPYTAYTWWLIAWETNQVLCEITIDHEGLPTVSEVAEACGSEFAEAWFTTPPCTDLSKCQGLYLHHIRTYPDERQVEVTLPSARVWIELEGCTLVSPQNLCPDLPVLVLRGEEPLAGERITAIQGSVDGQPFRCESDICKLPLYVTPLYGSQMEFWAESSYGDTSQVYTAQFRVVDSGVSNVPGGAGYYVDVISSQWKGPPLPSCAQIWESFPPVGEPPAWLRTPEQEELMATEEPYYYLAGRLISQGLVDVSACSTGGLLPNGYADACGLESARRLVELWQNQFDARIIEVAKESGLPAQLMKNLFAQESQFWPGIFKVPYEFGLGQLTDKGGEVVLIWNPDFFNQFCPLVLSQDACAGGYLGLNEEHRAILRGALALQAKSDCPSCPAGIDLSNVHFSIALFANTLKANCAQVSRTIFTITQQMAGMVSTYEDLWRMTIANYHAGPGCVAYAINQAWNQSGRISWEQIVPFFTDPCKGVVPYVDKITQ